MVYISVGRLPLDKAQLVVCSLMVRVAKRRKAGHLYRKSQGSRSSTSRRSGTHPECVVRSIMFAKSWVRTFVGRCSPYIFQYACALFLARATNTRKFGPTPEYTIPMFGQIAATRSITEQSTSMEEGLFSFAITILFDAGGRDYDLVQ